MKLRADKFEIVADSEHLERIQGEVHRHKAIYDGENLATREGANKILHLYMCIAFDEGYRAAIEQLKEDVGQYASKPIKLKRRSKKGFVEYSSSEEIQALQPLVKKRVDSKRQIKAQKQFDKEHNREFEQERFILSMCIHTAFEGGYLKGSSVEETAKWIAKDQERADLIVNLMKEFFPGDLSGK